MKKIVCVALATCLLLLATLVVACNGTGNLVKDVDDYVIVASYDEQTHQLSATQVVTITNRTDNVFASVKFHVYANCYREECSRGIVPNTYRQKAYPNGESWGEIAFDSVKVNDVAVAYTLEGDDMDVLNVPIEQTFKPNDVVTVETTYTVTLANVFHRLGYTDNAVNLANFYPVLCNVTNGNYDCSPYYNVGDPFVSQVRNYDVTLTLPKDYVVASSGNLISASPSDDCVTYNYQAQLVRDFAMVASKQYKALTSCQNGVNVNYYYFDDANAEQSLATAVGAFQFLSKNVGAYPYKQYSVCQTDFCYGGMEYPCLAFVARGSKSYDEAIAHETAHQWFYGVVGNDQIANAWQDEGLAEFLTALYLDKTGARKLSAKISENVKAYTTYVDVLNRYYDVVDTSLRSIDKYASDSEYVLFTYVKGCLLFNTLYETMGESKFFRALAHYYDQAKYQIATPSQLCQCFAKVGTDAVANLITSFVEGKEIIGKVTDKN